MTTQVRAIVTAVVIITTLIVTYLMLNGIQ
jgi:hypothetical protein